MARTLHEELICIITGTIGDWGGPEREFASAACDLICERINGLFTPGNIVHNAFNRRYLYERINADPTHEPNDSTASSKVSEDAT